MKPGLEQALGKVKKEGLPNADQMRADLARWEAEDFKEMLQSKLHEYRGLFDRFKAGEELTKQETERMASLSDALSKLADNT